MQGDSILKMQELHRVLNMSQYGWICLNRLWIWIWVNMSEFIIIDRAEYMHHTVHSARSLCKLMSTSWEISMFIVWSKI